MGVTIFNSEPTGATHPDRKLITGDSPFAANALGKLAAGALLKEVAGQKENAEA
jgi:molecular chaperone Hsp31 and glyoxalase 3